MLECRALDEGAVDRLEHAHDPILVEPQVGQVTGHESGLGRCEICGPSQVGVLPQQAHVGGGRVRDRNLEKVPDLPGQAGQGHVVRRQIPEGKGRPSVDQKAAHLRRQIRMRQHALGESQVVEGGRHSGIISHASPRQKTCGARGQL